MKITVSIVVILTIGALAYIMWPKTDHSAHSVTSEIVQEGALVNVLVPEMLSQNAQIGKQAFAVKCASCHGTNATGQASIAPPLVHIIYEPNHHGDESFQRAVAMGVSAHHWRFGDMPAVADVTRDDVKMIVAYIRELQRANGIN